MRVYFDCWFQYSRNGFVRSLYDLDIEKAIDYSANVTGDIANILDHTLGKSLILSVSDNRVLISILGVMDSQETKKMNVILEDSNLATMVGIYRYIYEHYDNFTKILLDSIQLERESEKHIISIGILNNEINLAKSLSLKKSIGNIKANELIFFEPLENYYEYQLNAREIFDNNPKNYSNTISAEEKKSIGKAIGWILFGLFVFGLILLKLLGVI